MNEYTVYKFYLNDTYTAQVAFDGTVYRWTSNDRVPPADAVKEYGIDKLPGYDAEAHRLAREADLEAFFRANYPALAKKKKRTTIKEQATYQIELARKAFREATKDLPPHPMGHAFVWAKVDVVLKNGKYRSYRVCLGSVCAEDLEQVVSITNLIKNVSNASYNLD
jgi:hypothetical protein